jgi:hypothetical protein
VITGLVSRPLGLQQLVEQSRHRVGGFPEIFHRSEGAIEETFDRLTTPNSSWVSRGIELLVRRIGDGLEVLYFQLPSLARQTAAA